MTQGGEAAYLALEFFHASLPEDVGVRWPGVALLPQLSEWLERAVVKESFESSWWL